MSPERKQSLLSKGRQGAVLIPELLGTVWTATLGAEPEEQAEEEPIKHCVHSDGKGKGKEDIKFVNGHGLYNEDGETSSEEEQKPHHYENKGRNTIQQPQAAVQDVEYHVRIPPSNTPSGFSYEEVAYVVERNQQTESQKTQNHRRRGHV